MKDGLCQFHVAHKNEIKRNQDDIQDLFKMDEKTTNKIDTMKNMVIAGLAGSIVQIILLLVGLIFAYLKLKV